MPSCTNIYSYYHFKHEILLRKNHPYAHDVTSGDGREGGPHVSHLSID